jgi:hypothetical protein
MIYMTLQDTIYETKGLYMINRRVCTTCKIEKSFDEFFNSKKGKWGKAEQCKDCRRIKNRIYDKNNPEKCREKHQRWANKNKPHLAEYNRKRYEENPEIFKIRSIAYRKKTGNQSIKDFKKRHPQKKMAHLYVELALKFGHLVRPTCCDQCQAECKPQAHHGDYSKPLDIQFLCTKCHGKEHRKYKDSEWPERLNEETSKEEAIV